VLDHVSQGPEPGTCRDIVSYSHCTTYVAFVVAECHKDFGLTLQLKGGLSGLWRVPLASKLSSVFMNLRSRLRRLPLLNSRPGRSINPLEHFAKTSNRVPYWALCEIRSLVSRVCERLLANRHGNCYGKHQLALLVPDPYTDLRTAALGRLW
jgi:hypothetical protein